MRKYFLEYFNIDRVNRFNHSGSINDSLTQYPDRVDDRSSFYKWQISFGTFGILRKP